MSEREKLAGALFDAWFDGTSDRATEPYTEWSEMPSGSEVRSYWLRRADEALTLLREQEREPEVEALARAYRHGWQDRGRHDKGDGPSTMSAWFSERYAPPTSTSEGAKQVGGDPKYTGCPRCARWWPATSEQAEAINRQGYCIVCEVALGNDTPEPESEDG